MPGLGVASLALAGVGTAQLSYRRRLLLGRSIRVPALGTDDFPPPGVLGIRRPLTTGIASPSERELPSEGVVTAIGPLVVSSCAHAGKEVGRLVLLACHGPNVGTGAIHVYVATVTDPDEPSQVVRTPSFLRARSEGPSTFQSTSCHDM